MSDALVVDAQFKVFADGTRIEQVRRPVRTAEIHLMQRSGCCSHQSPLKTVGGDVERQVGSVDVFHDGSIVPAWPVPVGLALNGITAHFQVSTVGIEDPWSLIGRDSDGTIHEG